MRLKMCMCSDLSLERGRRRGDPIRILADSETVMFEFTGSVSDVVVVGGK